MHIGTTVISHDNRGRYKHHLNSNIVTNPVDRKYILGGQNDVLVTVFS